MAEVELHGASATETLRYSGWRIEGRVKSLPVTSTTPPASFGFGDHPVESSRFEVLRSEGAEVQVTPWKLPNVTTKFRWSARAVSCTSLRLGGELDALCSGDERVAISLMRGAEPVWRVAYQSLDVDEADDAPFDGLLLVKRSDFDSCGV